MSNWKIGMITLLCSFLHIFPAHSDSTLQRTITFGVLESLAMPYGEFSVNTKDNQIQKNTK